MSRKPLRLLGGEPLIVRVIERARQVPMADRIVVATDAEEVARVVESQGIAVVMTSANHVSGSDRVAEVSRKAEFSAYPIVVNLQGDEPFMPPEAIAGAIEMVEAGFDIGTAASPLDPSRRHESHLVKVVCDDSGGALYFSRSAIPHLRDEADLGAARWWQHLGVYAWRREILLRITELPPSHLELTERLEQLRALEAGFTIGVAHLTAAAPAGIDTAADLEAAELRWHQMFKERP